MIYVLRSVLSHFLILHIFLALSMTWGRGMKYQHAVSLSWAITSNEYYMGYVEIKNGKKEPCYGNMGGFVLFFLDAFISSAAGITVLFILYGGSVALRSVTFFFFIFCFKFLKKSEIQVTFLTIFVYFVLSWWCFLSPDNKNYDVALYLSHSCIFIIK